MTVENLLKIMNMKLKLNLLAIAIILLSSCTQRTCPTYAKEDAQNKKATQEANT